MLFRKKKICFALSCKKKVWLSDCEKKSLVFYRKKIKRKSWGKKTSTLPPPPEIQMVGPLDI